MYNLRFDKSMNIPLYNAMFRRLRRSGSGLPTGPLDGIKGKRSPILRYALWTLLIVFSLTGIFGHSLWGTNETRGAGMIRDMFRSGSWTVPTMDGIPFLEKPPLLHWTALLLCVLSGRVTEGLVRLPAALYAFGTLALLYLLMKPARPSALPGENHPFPDAAAWAGVFACATTVEFFSFGRNVLSDMALAFCVMAGLFLFWRAYESRGGLRWLIFLLAAAGAFYAKGLIGPILIWAAVAVYLLWKRRWGLLAILGAAYIPILLVFVLPWVLAVVREAGPDAARFFFWDNQVGRFLHFSDAGLPHDPFFINKEPVWYYLTHLAPRLAPWSLMLLPALAAWFRKGTMFRDPLHTFVRCGVLGMFLVLHASTSKFAQYALPVYPFLFFMMGLWFVEELRKPSMGWAARWSYLLTLGILGLILEGVALAFLLGPLYKPVWFPGGGVLRPAAALLAAIAIPIGAWRMGRALHIPQQRWTAALFPAGVALTAACLFHLAIPVLEPYQSYKPAAEAVRFQIAQGREAALGCREYRDIGAFTYYLDRRMTLLDGADAIRNFLGDPKPRAVVLEEGALAALKPLPAGCRAQGVREAPEDSISRTFLILTNR